MKRILIAGVPYGCNNIGDEAILAGIVQVLREIAPDALITASTANARATTQKLEVETCSLLGFVEGHMSARKIRAEIRKHDVFIWGGATGLSDYPEVPLRLFKIAESLGKKTIVFCTAMESTFNPVKFTVLPGRKKKLLIFMKKITGINWINIYENYLVRRIRKTIERRLSKANLVILRDKGSQKQLRPLLPPYAADPALLLRKKRDLPTLKAPGKKIGFCLSTQKKHANLSLLVKLVDRMTDFGDVFFIPMNPTTDNLLHTKIREAMHKKGKAHLVEGIVEPEDVIALTEQLDLILSSRLHLLILGAKAGVPLIGLTGISKITHFLAPYGYKNLGKGTKLDNDAVIEEVCRQLKSDDRDTNKQILKEMLNRLDQAKLLLQEKLEI